MLDIISKVDNYFKKRRFVKHAEEIKFYLYAIDNKIDSRINNLKSKRTYITNEQIKEIKEGLSKELDFLNGDKFYALNKEIVVFVDNNKGLLSNLKEYSITNAKFKDLRERFLEKINTLDKVAEQVNREIKINTELVAPFLPELRALKNDYITNTQIEKLSSYYLEPYSFFKDTKEYIDESINEFVKYYSNLKEYIKTWNNEYIQREIATHKLMFDNIDGKVLDIQQRTAIITDEDNNLVLAGAGTGKTLTISGKVKYLVESKGVLPKEILLISFTRKASNELYERISEKLAVDVEVKTFHKLGLDIISKHREIKPDIFEDIKKIVNNYMEEEIYKYKDYIYKLVCFFSYYIKIPKEMEFFKNLEEYHDYYRNFDFETIKSKFDKATYVECIKEERKCNLHTFKGETVKSLEEYIIANFLYLNGINYIYEHPYKYDTSDEYWRQYKPDFYLPEYDIYIEHFGVNERMEAPWLPEIEEVKYIASMQWKRKIHKDNTTTLIESFSFYNKDGILLDKLENNLKGFNVEFREVDYKQLFLTIYNSSENRYFKEFNNLIATFIGLFKSNRYNDESFDRMIALNKKNENLFLKKRTELFFELVRPIYKYYQDYLSRTQKIDFHDMINYAADIVESEDIEVDYKYIIIDEYQDISRSRYNLIKAIRTKTNAKIICVGDDWQSIYRFAGSDIQLFTKFEEYFGYSSLLKIEKTYRNSQQLTDIAGNFVMRNPSQYKKDLKSEKYNDVPIIIFGYRTNDIEALIRIIHTIVTKHGENAEIMLLGRNNFDISIIDKHYDFKKKEDKNNKKVIVEYRKYNGLRMFFTTSHKSKGLEAENVILINASNILNGFPNQICDDPVLSWVLTDADNFRFAEERRLFYVAMTRTKNTFYILTPEHRMSEFIKELINDYGIKYEDTLDEESIINNPRCPKCQAGYLVIRTAGDADFLGCSNYPTCDYRTNYVEILNSQIRCSSCGGYMVLRKGNLGSFYGCNYYPECKNTRQIDQEGKTALKNNSIETNKRNAVGTDIDTNNQRAKEANLNFKNKKIETKPASEQIKKSDQVIDNRVIKTLNVETNLLKENDILNKSDVTNKSSQKPGCVGIGELRIDKLDEKAKEYADKGDWGEEALKINKRIIELNRRYDIVAYTRLARCYIELGKIPEAIKIYEQALIIDKNNIIAKNGIDRLKRRQINMNAIANNKLKNMRNSTIKVYGPYISHCHNCKNTVTSEMKRCAFCKWYICKACDACGCDYNKNSNM